MSEADEKERLEIEKLRAEVSELGARAYAQRAVSSRIQVWVGIFIAVVALASGVVAFLTQSGTFLNQLKKENKFKVTQEMITLAQQLGSDSPVERANAALLLSSFEEDAVPILVSNFQNYPELAKRLTDSLVLILQKENIEPRQVLWPLLDELVDFFDAEYQAEEPAVKVITAYIDALAEVGGGQNDGRIIKGLNCIRAKIDARESKITPPDRTGLRQIIDQAIDVISKTD